MPRLYKKIKKVALPPGTLIPVEGEQASKVRIIDYNDQVYQVKDIPTIEESFEFRDTPTVTWINIDGRNLEVMKKIDEYFGIHPLVLEDIVNAGQRPKIEDYGDYIFLVVKMIRFDEVKNDIEAEQIGLVLGQNYVISFQEKEGDVFDPIRNRIRDSKGKIRHMEADYLAYALLDAIVDHYFVILEKIGEHIDNLEHELLEELNQETPLEIHKLKTQVIYLRKQIWPLREVLASVQRTESKLIKKSTNIYLRDVYDHTIQVNDTLEAFRESLSGLHDIYLSSVSNRMNEIMKVLTIFAAIFIPLTFMAGIYGMNFEFMPELKWKYGYFVLLGLMAGVGIGLMLIFKRKKWM